MSSVEPISVDEILAQAGWVRRLAHQLASDSSSADDLAQGALTSAIERPPAAGRPIRPWLRRVVTNLARKEHRGSVRRAARENLYAQGAREVPATDRLLVELDEQKRIARLVGELRDPYRRVLLLHYYRELSAVEIARSHGVPAGTVRSQIARGLALLRERMNAQHGGDERRTRGALLVAAGLDHMPTSMSGPESLVARIPVAAEVLLMKLSTKSMVTVVAFVGILAGTIGLFGFGLGDPEPHDEPHHVVGEVSPRQGRFDLGKARPEPSAVREGVVTSGDVTSVAKVPDAPVPDELGRTVFRARAVDRAGKPVAGARFESVTSLGEPRALGNTTVSAADGRVQIALEKAAFFTYAGHSESNTYLALGADSYSTRFLVPAAKLGTTKDLGDLVIDPGGTVEGRVIDASGRPVEGALVVATADGVGSVNSAARIVGPDRTGGRPASRTDSFGRFSLRGGHVGNIVVWTNAKAMAWSASDPIELAAGAVHRGVELVLEELAANAMAAGVVVDPSNKPVPGAVLRHVASSGGKEGRLRADETGAFVIPVAGGGSFRLAASDPEQRFGPSAERTVKAGDVDLRVPLTAAERLRIRVVRKSDRSPIENAAIMALPPDGGGAGFLHARWERSDEKGRCRMIVPGEPFRITVGHTSFIYRKFGPYEPTALPEEIYVELEQKPMIRGVVRAGDEPVEGALVELLELTEDKFRPVHKGVPLRLFDGGIEKATTDAKGEFGLPINEHAESTPVLLVTKRGYALSEAQLHGVDPKAGADGVEVHLTSGGSIEGVVEVGPNRTATSVVVLASRGDGKPVCTRPDADGRFRFEGLTPGQWRIEDRETEPEGRVFGMAQGDEHPFRWDCTVVDHRTTRYDLDLRWQDNLQVTGRLAFDGLGAEGWTAVLEAPDHSDRPWALRPVVLAADGGFALAARPGYAKLVLRAPSSNGASFVIERDLLVDRRNEPNVFEFAIAGVEGAAEDGVTDHRLFHLVDSKTRVKAEFKADARGRIRVDDFVAGKASLQRRVEGRFGVGWYGRTVIDLVAGEIQQLK